MDQSEGMGALENIANITKANFESSGYPSNLSDDDKTYIIKRLMDFANEDFNPWANGATGLPLLIKEKYGKDL